MKRQNERRLGYVSQRWYLLPLTARVSIGLRVARAFVVWHVRQHRAEVVNASSVLFGLVVFAALANETPLVSISMTILAAFYAALVGRVSGIT